MKQKNRDPERAALAELLHRTKADMEAARSAFEYVTDPQMISSCIFEMNAVQERYSYLLKKLRELDAPAAVREEA